jgi:hypothetical protein
MLYILEFILTVVISVVLVTQVCVPLFKGLPTFPFFRSKKNLEDELANANLELTEQEIENSINKVKSKIKSTKRKA